MLENSKKNLTIHSLIEFACIYFLIFIPGGYQMNAYSGVLIMSMLLILSIVVFFKGAFKGNTITVQSEGLACISVIVACFIISSMLNGENGKQMTINIGFFLAAYVFSIYYSKNVYDYVERFVTLMYFLCVYSLIIWTLYHIAPFIIERLPRVVNSKGRVAYNAIFCTIYNNAGHIRNQGIFWEPGAFQTFINFALIFNLFLIKKKIKKYTIVFAIALVTTFSTMGFVVGFFCAFTYSISLFISTDEKHKKKVTILLVIFFIIFVFLVFYNNLSNQMKHQLFGKVANFFESFDVTSYDISKKTINRTSTSVRFDAFFKPFSIFNSNAIFGAGIDALDATGERLNYLNVCTFVNWIVAYGSIVGFILIFGLYKFCCCLHKNKFIRVLIFIIMLLAISSEDYKRNPSIILYSFLGYSIKYNTEFLEKKNEDY
ncbi:MAG: hypothetical protein E7404_03535 [Ruminococcaceae bacterium]|nr:hypothetical protein [Oscillospiraceae bacterium]